MSENTNDAPPMQFWRRTAPIKVEPVTMRRCIHDSRMRRAMVAAMRNLEAKGIVTIKRGER